MLQNSRPQYQHPGAPPVLLAQAYRPLERRATLVRVFGVQNLRKTNTHKPYIVEILPRMFFFSLQYFVRKKK